MKRSVKLLVRALLVVSIYATIAFAEYSPLVNGSFTDNELSSWHVWKPAGGAAERDTTVYSSGPASLKLTGVGISYAGFEQTVWNSAVDATGQGFPSFPFILKFMAKQDGVSSGTVLYNLHLWSESGSYIAYIGWIRIELRGGSKWESYYDSTDINTAHYGWETETFKDKVIRLLNGGKGSFGISLRCEITNGTAWLDDFCGACSNITNCQQTSLATMIPKAKYQPVMNNIRIHNRGVQFSTPANYTLSVLGAQGNIIATEKGYGTYAIAPKNLATGSYIFKVNAGPLGTAVDKIFITK